MKPQPTFWKSGHLATLICSFLYFDVSFMIWVLLGALGKIIPHEQHFFGMARRQFRARRHAPSRARLHRY